MREINTLNEFIQEAQGYDEIVIYGAGGLGQWIMKNKVYVFGDADTCSKMSCFCDQQADVLQNHIKDKIYTIDDLKDKNICMLICTRISEKHLKDVHRTIVNRLKDNNVTGVCLNINNIVKKTEKGILTIGNYIFFENTFTFLRNVYRNDICDRENMNRMIDEYAQAIHPVLKNGSYELLDYEGEFYNIVNGKRVTLPVFDYDEGVNTVHCFGDSRILSVFTNDENTICSHLQRRYGKNRRVVNYGMQFRGIERMIYQIKMAEILKHDVVILGTDWSGFAGKDELLCAAISLEDIKQICKEKGALFIFVEIPSLYEMDYKGKGEQLLIRQLIPTYNVNNSELKKIFECTLSMLGIDYIDLARLLNAELRNSDIYVDLCHFNSYGNEIIAKVLFAQIEKRIEIKNFISNNKGKRILEERQSAFEKEKEVLNNQKTIEGYTHELKNEYSNIVQGKNCGCIVMNCNPFTNGHYYLIDKARTQVDILFVFVLEEDRSFFRFKDRFDMVKGNTKHFDNVLVLKSGEFVISSLTFPEYFEKDRLQDAKIDTSKDIITFAQYIAPSLNISKRFVGEEPYDRITKQYNEQLKMLLPQYEIELIEIPRCMNEMGEIISATKVRKCIDNKQINLLLQYVPQYTYEVICDRYINKEE